MKWILAHKVLAALLAVVIIGGGVAAAVFVPKLLANAEPQAAEEAEDFIPSFTGILSESDGSPGEEITVPLTKVDDHWEYNGPLITAAFKLQEGYVMKQVEPGIGQWMERSGEFECGVYDCTVWKQ